MSLNTPRSYLETLLNSHQTIDPHVPFQNEGSTRLVTQKQGVWLTDQVFLPQGTWIQVPLYALHNYSKNWPDTSPHEFHPSRWLSLSIEKCDCPDNGKKLIEANKADVDENEDDLVEDDIKKRRALCLETNVTSTGSYVGWGPTPVSRHIALLKATPACSHNKYTAY